MNSDMNKTALGKVEDPDFRSPFISMYFEKLKLDLDRIMIDFSLEISEIIDVLLDARNHGKNVFIMGNGGSSSTASHFVGDLSKGAIVHGKPRFKAISLTDNAPNVLAWANDKSYEDIFTEQLKNLMNPQDIVIGISGSGNSENVIKAINYANEAGCVTIGFSGFDGGKLLKIAQYNIHVDDTYMQRVEDVHLILEHLLTSIIREEGL
jgi:D-sedoheptulose 7-phosphate isomerase